MKSILQFAAILLVGAAIVVGTTWITNLLKKPLVVQNTIEKPIIVQPPQCPNNFSSYKDLLNLNQSVRLVKDLNTYASNGKFIHSISVNITRSGAAKIACGYLYVRAGIDGHSLDQKYDSVYISPQELGGQILRSKSIAIPNPIINTTELLLPLETVSYLPSLPYNPDAQNYRIANWVYLLNTANNISFRIGLSTLDPRGIINEITIAYKCWDPNTGQPSNDCQLSNE